jgi:outer membrane receptor protein involved in Fe transport
VATPYDGGRTKLIIGRAFRAPSVYELFYNDGGVTQKVPVDGLAAETVITAEIEHVHQLGQRAYVLGSLFGSRIEELIGLTVDPADGLLVYANSSHDVWSTGLELEARWSRRSGAWLLGALSLTHLDTDDAEVRTNSAPLSVIVKGYWPVTPSALGLGAQLVYTGPRPDREGGETDHALRLDLVASGLVGPGGVRFRIAVYNLFDQRYDVPVGADFKQVSITQDGRTFSAEVAYER